ncbi:hypothetical protein QOZ80_2AG0133720 [Eleusine coracana subsp. coracana]|nr:hypothetical protein QOZ80_2AG0133720 [Eleusine coracana subsp. coracana]
MRDACVLQRLVPLVEAAVADVCRNGTSVPRSVGIADLGCSSGPNALFFVSAVVDAVRRRCKTSTELRVFLNDLPSDDFNAVFRQIPAFLQRDPRSEGCAVYDHPNGILNDMASR